jgi:nitroimidazol reductase NimA-like FMN-containing flavoprotein (pyridoxamine 5'-phosphate oxidase superfamily)
MPPDQQQDGLAALARRVIDDNVYMVLGTADAAGRPWTSPVFFAAEAYRDLYWVSSPDVTHSRNLAERPELSIVVFDSRAPVGTGGESAVYMAGTAAEVPPDELEATLAAYPGFSDRGGREFTPDGLQPPAPLRLYRATVTDHYVLCPLEGGGVPCAEHGLRVDHRTRVDMSG